VTYQVENDQADEIWDLRAQLKTAQDQIAAMTLARDPATVDGVVANAVVEIEDAIIRGYDGVRINGKIISPSEVRRDVLGGIVKRVVQGALSGGN
jgi:hypothetical protein